MSLGTGIMERKSKKVFVELSVYEARRGDRGRWCHEQGGRRVTNSVTRRGLLLANTLVTHKRVKSLGLNILSD